MSDEIKPVAWIKDTSLPALQRGEANVIAYPNDFLIRPSIPLYTDESLMVLRAEIERLQYGIRMALECIDGDANDPTGAAQYLRGAMKEKRDE